MSDLTSRVSRWGIQLVLVGIAVSCKKETGLQKAKDHFLRVQAAYCTNNVQAAEKVLIDDLRALSDMESRHVEGIDYDMARTIDHERLFLIYRKTRVTNKMEFEFQRSMECLRRFDEKLGLPPPTNFTYEVLADKMERFDRGLDVKWKKE